MSAIVLLRHTGGDSGKRRYKGKGERSQLNAEAEFLSSLPMKHLNVCKKETWLLLLNGVQSTISD
jgi:hypothetical protein